MSSNLIDEVNFKGKINGLMVDVNTNHTTITITRLIIMVIREVILSSISSKMLQIRVVQVVFNHITNSTTITRPMSGIMMTTDKRLEGFEKSYAKV